MKLLLGLLNKEQRAKFKETFSSGPFTSNRFLDEQGVHFFFLPPAFLAAFLPPFLAAGFLAFLATAFLAFFATGAAFFTAAFLAIP